MKEKILTPGDQAVRGARTAKKQEQQRRWALTHREQTRAYGRAFYRRNTERRKADSREYNRMHREERRSYSKEYYQRKKAENPHYVKELNERSRVYRESYLKRNEARHRQYCKEHKVENCRKTLSNYAYRSMERIKQQFPKAVERYLLLYPFEQYGDRIIRSTLSRNRIYCSYGEYDDCYEAGMLAYLYSIHRCAAMGCDYTVRYIRKMVRIYMICALVVYHDVKNLCQTNGFHEIRLDADTVGRRY